MKIYLKQSRNIMAEYISFFDLDTQMTDHPIQGEIWETFDEKTKLKYHNYVHQVIDSHPWKGDPVDSPVQIAAFPRCIEGIIVRWNTDTERSVNHIQYRPKEHVISNWILVETVAYLLSTKEIETLLVQRDEGLGKVEVGPIRAEFRGNRAGTQAHTKTPLPLSLWNYLKQYSLFQRNEPSETFRINRV